MKTIFFICIGIALLSINYCKQNIECESTNYIYYDVEKSDTILNPTLFAVTDEEYLQFGSNVAYINASGDTIIPFNKYAYFGTDTFKYFAYLIEHPNDSTWGRNIAIDRNQNILFDIVIFDNGPDFFKEGLIRVIRNCKMGFANKYGQVIIPCIYDYAKWFENGQAEVTFKAKEFLDMEEHRRVESKEWFKIDKKGNKIK